MTCSGRLSLATLLGRILFLPDRQFDLASGGDGGGAAGSSAASTAAARNPQPRIIQKAARITSSPHPMRREIDPIPHFLFITVPAILFNASPSAAACLGVDAAAAAAL